MMDGVAPDDRRDEEDREFMREVREVLVKIRSRYPNHSSIDLDRWPTWNISLPQTEAIEMSRSLDALLGKMGGQE
jgi:hypothetical protein